jgi:hypothetical protein
VVSLVWLAAGLGVIVIILGLGLHINRKKAAGHLAVRLAEAYRSQGRFEVARSLYAVPVELDQNVPEAREGDALAEQEVTEPVIEPALVERARQRLVDEREELVEHFGRHGVDVDLPPLDFDEADLSTA